MSDVIKLLPDTVANQIAAGEVIQRPSSVIKELVENAVDAGATKVQIIVVEAGKDCIQVVDNGKGMSDTDTRLAFERHATSKINDASDLFALHTKGFRGEALPSIAAVAQVELKTKQKDAEIGTSLIIEGGVVREQTPVTCPVGANFIVKNLFYNKAPLHDGAVIIRNNRVYAAGCVLPMTDRHDILKDLGTRHRAAIGMSENSDAISIIVSEETGTISMAVNGELRRNYDYNMLKQELTALLSNNH